MLPHTGTHGPTGTEEEAGDNVQAGPWIRSVTQVVKWEEEGRSSRRRWHEQRQRSGGHLEHPGRTSVLMPMQGRLLDLANKNNKFPPKSGQTYILKKFIHRLSKKRILLGFLCFAWHSHLTQSASRHTWPLWGAFLASASGQLHKGKLNAEASRSPGWSIMGNFPDCLLFLFLNDY